MQGKRSDEVPPLTKDAVEKIDLLVERIGEESTIERPFAKEIALKSLRSQLMIMESLNAKLKDSGLSAEQYKILNSVCASFFKSTLASLGVDKKSVDGQIAGVMF